LQGKTAAIVGPDSLEESALDNFHDSSVSPISKAHLLVSGVSTGSSRLAKGIIFFERLFGFF